MNQLQNLQRAEPDAMARARPQTQAMVQLRSTLAQRSFPEQMAAIQPAAPVYQPSSGMGAPVQLSGDEEANVCSSVDPDLDCNVTGTPSSPDRRDPQQANGVIPFRPDGSWNPSEVLQGLSQHDDDPLTIADRNRCTSAAALAIHIQAGPAAVARVAQTTAARIQRYLEPGDPQFSVLRPEQQQGLRQLLPIVQAIPGRLSSRTATFADLRRLADAQQLGVNPTATDRGLSGPDDHTRLASTGGGTYAYIEGIRSGNHQGWQPLADLAARLTADHATNVGVILNIAPAEDRARRSLIHAVTFGVDETGNLYFYEPSARDGSQVLSWASDQQDIRDYFEDRDGTARPWRIVSIIGPRPAAASPSP